MSTTLTVENYVKTIYQLCGEGQTGSAATGEIARRLVVSPGTVTSMLKTLADSGLAHYQAYEGVRLTETGSRLALRVLRRHRLIEQFLVHTLGMSWDEVHEEAEHMEHAVSDRLIDRIDTFLQYPERDPHGDPIPRPDGSLAATAHEPLASLAAPCHFVLERVLDQSPEFLRYLSDAGLTIGATAALTENHPHAGALAVFIDGQAVTMSCARAAQVLVRRLPAEAVNPNA